MYQVRLEINSLETFCSDAALLPSWIDSLLLWIRSRHVRRVFKVDQIPMLALAGRNAMLGIGI